ncbi:MAG: site-2 protease family protein, partial [Candidatus Omnitrophica bacterium]|nr:site-2 protease family protein [Candidatus Omnitrophota bacterium]
GWGKSFYQGAEKLLSLSAFTYKALWFVVTRRLSFKESFAGPIMIFKLTGTAARMGFIYLLHLMALLSMSLAIFNFLPLPVLDGGHLFFLLVEKIRKRPISVRAQAIAAQLGMFFLISLMLFVSYYDVLRAGWIEKLGAWWKTIGPK